MSETYLLPQGKITIIFCDENRSIGLLELNPNQELSKHDRPVNEELMQIYGESIIKMIEEDKIIEETTIREYEELVVPVNKPHIHANPTDDRSITLWKFEGNIVKVIKGIRNNFKRV